MEKQPKDWQAIIFYAVAMFGNVIGWTWNNANEKYPFWVFVTCIIAMAGAGYLTVRDRSGDWKPWVGWSAFVGVVLACALCFMV